LRNGGLGNGAWNGGAAPRRATRAVAVGDVFVGGEHPILIQSMTVADTMNTLAVVAEIRELVEAGCPLVRLTAPSMDDARNLKVIREALRGEGIHVPLVADIHFTPNAALIAADYVEKVRINPGNYADRKRFEAREYTDAEYGRELERVADRFRPLVRRLRQNGVALRIGTNHGSLSDRIMNRFGDTPQGMVESALEFVRICEEEDFRDIVLSMKSSIPQVMIEAYRLLVRRMDELGMDYPLHLGVTEAGDGLEGRIKSAIGIGALLLDGIGDTIRVSLTEDSRHEIPAARAILKAVEAQRAPRDASPATMAPPERTRRPADGGSDRGTTGKWTLRGMPVGGGEPVRVERVIDFASRLSSRGPGAGQTPDAADRSSILEQAVPARDAAGWEILSVHPSEHGRMDGMGGLRRVDAFPAGTPPEGSAFRDLLQNVESVRQRFPRAPLVVEIGLTAVGSMPERELEHLLSLVDGVSVSLDAPAEPSPESLEDRVRLMARLCLRGRRALRVRVPLEVTAAGDPPAIALRLATLCREEGLAPIGLLCQSGPDFVQRARDLAAALHGTPSLVFLEGPAHGPEGAMTIGTALLEQNGDAILLTDAGEPWPAGGRDWVEHPDGNAFAILQACRLRLTKAEFIACPSCGRTQFDLQTTTALIRRQTEHLRGIKIAIMGCIVNGPGEMADADFGYVGSGPARVDLYVGRERVRQGIDQAEAPQALIDLIRDRGRWIDPPSGAESSHAAPADQARDGAPHGGGGR